MTNNQAGSTALLLAGGLGLLMSLTGRVPDRIGKEGLVHERDEGPAERAIESVLRDDANPVEVRERIARAYRESVTANRSDPIERARPAETELIVEADAAIYEYAVFTAIESILPVGAERDTHHVPIENHASPVASCISPDAVVQPVGSADVRRMIAVNAYAFASPLSG